MENRVTCGVCSVEIVRGDLVVMSRCGSGGEYIRQ